MVAEVEGLVELLQTRLLLLHLEVVVAVVLPEVAEGQKQKVLMLAVVEAEVAVVALQRPEPPAMFE